MLSGTASLMQPSTGQAALDGAVHDWVTEPCAYLARGASLIVWVRRMTVPAMSTNSLAPMRDGIHGISRQNSRQNAFLTLCVCQLVVNLENKHRNRDTLR